MQTQGISLVASNLSGKTSGRSTKANDATFDSFMSDHASGMERQPSNRQDAKTGNALVVKTEKNAAPADTVSVPVKKAGQEESFAHNINVKEAGKKISRMLQEALGLTEEELQDILLQSGIDLGLLPLQFTYSDNTLWPAAAYTLQNLVMEVHGIADKAVFLTNSDLQKELSDILGKVTEVLTDAMKELEYSMAPEASQEVLPEEILTQDEPILPQKSAEIIGRNVENAPVADSQEPLSEFAGQQEEEPYQVIVETGTETESDTADDSPDTQTPLSQTTQEEVPADFGKTGANLFTERLAEAFRPEAETPVSVSRTMTQIVEQVIRQVRVRVMPETTSMELQLHPASLGRVNLQVSSHGSGAATAMLVVENQMAKEALESQLITLKETFEEQGLKVDAVEVTVSEFGLNSQSGQKSQEQAGGRQKNRRFRREIDGEMAQEDATGATEAARRDEDSVVDYTA